MAAAVTGLLGVIGDGGVVGALIRRPALDRVIVMKVHYEFGSRQHNKHGEELCGDHIIFSVLPDFLTLVVADGPGSGNWYRVRRLFQRR